MDKPVDENPQCVIAKDDEAVDDASTSGASLIEDNVKGVISKEDEPPRSDEPSTSSALLVEDDVDDFLTQCSLDDAMDISSNVLDKSPIIIDDDKDDGVEIVPSTQKSNLNITLAQESQFAENKERAVLKVSK
jgi:hypothetical protein